MNRTDVAIFADPIVADRVGVQSSRPPPNRAAGTNGSDWLAERFGIFREAHRFDSYWIRSSYQKPKLLRTSVVVIRR